MDYELIQKLSEKDSLTENEVNFFLEMVCKEIRKSYGVVDPFSFDCKVCFETSLLFGRLLYFRYGFDINQYDIKQLLQIPITHYINTITLNVDGDEKTYLVDMTFSQFFDKNIVLDNDKKVSTKSNFKKIEDVSFVKKLREKGFVLLTSEVATLYAKSFLAASGVIKKESDFEKIYDVLVNNQKIGGR